MNTHSRIKVAIFSSGSGSNAENIINYFKDHPVIEIAHIFCNKPDAYVIQRAERLHVPVTIFSKKEFYESQEVLLKIQALHIRFIVLAGFLLLIPKYLVESFPLGIINIHPALLPRHGGKGMYGNFVHKAVIESGDKETGITIHYVNEQYDEGNVIFQISIPVDSQDTVDTIAKNIHALEYEHFPKIIEQTILAKKNTY